MSWIEERVFIYKTLFFIDNIILTFVRAQDICYKQVDKKIPLSYIIVIKENKLN